MNKKIVQISPFDFGHLGGVEKYAEILEEIFPRPNPLLVGEGDNKTENLKIPPHSVGEEARRGGIFTLCGGKDFPIFEPVKNCPVPKFWQKNFWKPFDEISPKNTKIILSHIRFAPTSWLAFWLAKRKKIPYIHIEHGTGFLIHKNFFVRNIAKLVDLTIGKYILKNAYFVICASRAGENWVKNFAKRDKNITTIYRGFTPHPNPLPAGEGERIKEGSSKTPKIGFVGRLTPLKNVNTLIEALKNLKHLPWECKIVGDGEMRGEWENLVKKYQLEDRIIFLGAKENGWILEHFYPKIDIFVNPSLQEGLPTTIIEAKLALCEVLATNVGGTSEIPDISLCEPTTFSLTKNLEKLLKNHSLRKSFHSEEFPFTKEKMKENFEKIFNLF